MYVTLKINESNFQCNLNAPIDISIPLEKDNSPIAFGAAPFNVKPFKAGDFVGSLEAGAPVNFFNVEMNPHGNGTHTESVLHIDKRGKSINKTLSKFHFISRLVSLTPAVHNGDWLIGRDAFPEGIIEEPFLEALIIRTLPNEENKKTENYTGNNPAYLSPDFIERLNQTNIQHLLLDLPSVDREQDGGKLAAHNCFWQTKNKLESQKTITEMIYVDNDINDGLYLLNIQIPAFELDAAPSKPVLYRLQEI